jgi:HEAT repeats
LVLSAYSDIFADYPQGKTVRKPTTRAFPLRSVAKSAYRDIFYALAVLLLGANLSQSQQSDAWSRFFGEETKRLSGTNDSVAAEVEAQWKRLLVGPRYDRRDARVALAAAGSRAAKRLLPELEAESGEARRQAALTLGRLDSPTVREALLGAVRGRGALRDETRLRHAALALAELREQRAAPLLRAQFGRVKRPLTRHLLLIALSRLGADDPTAADELLRFRDRDRSLAGRVVLSLVLGQLPLSDASEKHLASQRRSRRDEQRLAAFLASAAQGMPELNVQRALANERDPRVLEAMLLGLASGSFRGAEGAVRHLNHENASLRRAAALALGRSGGTAARDLLLRRLDRERDAAVRAAVVFALRDFSDDDVRARLREERGSGGKESAAAALLALELANPGTIDLPELVLARRGQELLAFDLVLLRSPSEARALVPRILEAEGKGARGRDLATLARRLEREGDDQLLRRLAATRLQLEIDRRGWSADWLRILLTHELFKEVENLNRPLDGRESIRVSATGAARVLPRMNKEEEDLRLWFDRHPLFDRRRAVEVPELAPILEIR